MALFYRKSTGVEIPAGRLLLNRDCLGDCLLSRCHFRRKPRTLFIRHMLLLKEVELKRVNREMFLRHMAIHLLAEP